MNLWSYWFAGYRCSARYLFERLADRKFHYLRFWGFAGKKYAIGVMRVEKVTDRP